LARALITVDSFKLGIIDDSTTPSRSGGQTMSEMDIFSEAGVMKAEIAASLTAVQDAISNLFTGMTEYSDGTSTQLLAITIGDKKLYYRDGANGDKWTIGNGGAALTSGTAVTGLADVAEFAGKCYIAGTKEYLCELDGVPQTNGSYDFTFATFTDQAQFHPMRVFASSLFIGDGRYVAELESDGVTFNATSLTLPEGTIIKCIEPIGDFLAIGTGNASSAGGDPDFSKVYFWDGTSDTYNDVINVNVLGGVMGMKQVGNRLYLMARRFTPPSPSGLSLYVYNGANFDLVKHIENAPTANDVVQLYGNAMEEDNGSLLFGSSQSIDSSTQTNGVWKWGRRDVNDNFALTFKHKTTAATTAAKLSDTRIGVIKAYNNRFLFSWYDGSTYGVDGTSSSRKTGARFESQKYELENVYGTLIRGIRFVGRPLAASTSVQVDYKIDNASSWTTLGTLTSTDQNNVLYGISKLATTIQIALQYTCNSTDTPEATRVEIF